MKKKTWEGGTQMWYKHGCINIYMLFKDNELALQDHLDVT